MMTKIAIIILSILYAVALLFLYTLSGTLTIVPFLIGTIGYVAWFIILFVNYKSKEDKS